jgi:hypothetical protein
MRPATLKDPKCIEPQRHRDTEKTEDEKPEWDQQHTFVLLNSRL